MGGSRKIPMNSLWGYTDPNRGDPSVGARDDLHKRPYFDLHQCRGSQTKRDVWQRPST